jgi:hypothetical protein
MKPGDWVIWDDKPAEIVTVYNDGLNLVIRAAISKNPQAVNRIESFNKYEVFTVKTEETTPIPKEVADIMREDL